MSDYEPTPSFDELPLFGCDPTSIARQADPVTSKEAASDVMPSVGIMATSMLHAIADANEIDVHPTAQEAAKRCEFEHGRMAESYRKRTTELVRAGLVRVTGERRCDVTGKNAQTYEVVK